MNEETVNKTLKSETDNDSDFKNTIDELVDSMIEEEADGYHNNLEPFEVHANRMRQEMHQGMNEFRDQFLDGYRILMEELVYKYGSVSPSNTAPPKGIKI